MGVTLAVLIALTVTGRLRTYEALVLAGLVALCAMAGLALTAIRRLQGSQARSDHHVMKRTAAVSTRIDDVGAAASQHREEIHRGMTWHLNRIYREQGRLYPQIEALIDLRASVPLRASLPPLRGWAASPDILSWMTTWVRYHQPALIVECGSGASTLLFGYELQQSGVGRVISLEHDEDYAVQTRELADRHGVDDRIEVRYAPLKAWQQGDESWDWYDCEAIADLDEIDLLFVDGPPIHTGKLARYPAGPLLLTRLARDGIAVLDDGRRTDESRVSDRWLEEIAGLDREKLLTDKGSDVFRWR
jgi:predicted O-methyltransferase YrrM